MDSKEYRPSRRILAFLLAFALAFGAIPATLAHAGEPAADIPIVSELALQGEAFAAAFEQQRVDALEFIAHDMEQQRGLIGFHGEYALAGDDSLVSVIVVFESAPPGVQVALAEVHGEALQMAAAELIAQDDHALFRQELNALFGGNGGFTPFGANYTITHEYHIALNGVAITLPSNRVADLANFESVRAVFPNEMIYLPPVDVEQLMIDNELLIQALNDARNPLGMRSSRDRTGAGDLHDLGYKGAGVLIAVVDTGVAYDHPAFLGSFPTLEYMRENRGATHLTEADTIWIDGGYIFCHREGELVYIEGDYFYVGRDLVTQAGRENPNPASPMETRPGQFIHEGAPVAGSMHGTHVSGIALARDAGGELASLGMAPEARAVHYRAFAPGGLASDTIGGIERAARDNVDILNNSWGTTGGTDPSSANVLAVNNIVVSNGIIVTNSTGNAGPGFFTATPPAHASLGIPVGSTTEPMMEMHFEGGGVDTIITFFAPPTFPMWYEYGDTGRFVTEFAQTTHDDGVMRIIPLPVTAGSEGAPGNADLPVGSGVPADFAALDAAFTEAELQGAFLLVRRGSPFIDTGNSALERGMGGVILINGTGQPMISGGVTTSDDFRFPYFNISHVDGRALATYITTPGGTTVNRATPFAITGYGEHSPFGVITGSSRGPIHFTFELSPAIVAQGHAVISTVPCWTAGNERGDHTNAYGIAGGTSMSAPTIAGAAALVLDYVSDPVSGATDLEGRWGIDYWQVRARMMNTAIPVPHSITGQNPPPSVFEEGAGYVNVYAAARANTVVSVLYPRVATAPNVFEGETRSGSFSFGPIGVGTSRSLTARIDGTGEFTVRHEFNTGTRNLGTGSTLTFDTTTVQGGEYFTAELYVPADADFDLFHEGFVIVEQNGETVARLPFAGVPVGPPPDYVIEGLELLRPVITTNSEFRHNPQSNTLSIIFTALHNMPMYFNVFVYYEDGTPLTGTTDGFIHATQSFSPVMHAQIDRLRHNLVSFGEAFLPGHDDPEGGEFNVRPAGPDLEEGQYILRVELFANLPIFGWTLYDDVEFDFWVDNTPPVISTLEAVVEIDGVDEVIDLLDDVDGVVVQPDIDFDEIDQITLRGTVSDEMLNTLVDEDALFYIWREGHANRTANLPSNLAVYVLLGQLDYDPPAPDTANPAAVRNAPPTRVNVNADGEFSVNLNVAGMYDWDINIWVVDSYAPTPRLRNELGQMTSWFLDAHTSFNPSWTRSIPLAQLADIQLGRLAGWGFNAAHTAPMNENVWLGGNVLNRNVLVAPALEMVTDIEITIPVLDGLGDNEWWTGRPLPLNQHAAVVPAYATRRAINWELVSVNGNTSVTYVPYVAEVMDVVDTFIETVSLDVEGAEGYIETEAALRETGVIGTEIPGEVFALPFVSAPAPAALDIVVDGDAAIHTQTIGDVTLTPAGVLTANQTGTVTVRATIVGGLLGDGDFYVEFDIEFLAPVLTARENIGIWRPIISGRVSPPGGGLPEIREFPSPGFLGGASIITRSNISPVTFGFEDNSGTVRNIRFYIGPQGEPIGTAGVVHHATVGSVPPGGNFFVGDLLRAITGGTLGGITGFPDIRSVTGGTLLEQGVYTLTMFIANPGGEDLVVPFDFVVTDERPTIVYDTELFAFAEGDTTVTISGRVQSFGHDMAIQYDIVGMTGWIAGNINLLPEISGVFDYSNTWLRFPGVFGPDEVPVNDDGTFSFTATVLPEGMSNAFVSDGEGRGLIPTVVNGAWNLPTFAGANRSVAHPFHYTAAGFGDIPPTGMPSLTGFAVGAAAFLALSGGLWVFVLRRKGGKKDE